MDSIRSANSILLVTAEDPLPFRLARDRWSEDGTRPLRKCRLENADRLFFHRDWPMETVEPAESSPVEPPCISMWNCWESCKQNARSFGIFALDVLSFLPRTKNIGKIMHPSTCGHEIRVLRYNGFSGICNHSKLIAWFVISWQVVHSVSKRFFNSRRVLLISSRASWNGEML